MGLYVDVGQLARCVAAKDRDAVRRVKRKLKKLNEALKDVRLNEHHEPEDLKGKEPWGCKIAGLYWLTPLRRLAAHAWVSAVEYDRDVFETWPAPWQDDGINGPEDPVLASYYTEGRSLFDHLMYHDETKGYYVPSDFYEPIYPAAELREDVGEQIGSTYGLRDDCEAVANMIGLPPDLDPTSKCFRDATSSAAKLGDGWWNYPTEAYVCLQLITACRKSIELGSVITFG
jgi:hypothetical protein